MQLTVTDRQVNRCQNQNHHSHWNEIDLTVAVIEKKRVLLHTQKETEQKKIGFEICAPSKEKKRVEIIKIYISDRYRKRAND